MKRIDYSKLKAKPETEDFSGKYENSNYISKYLLNNYFKAVNRLLKLTENVNTGHEIGIGEGNSTIRLKDMIDELSGSEFLEKLIPIARKNNPNIFIFQESVYELKFEKNSIDLVFLLEVLEHLDYPKLALKEIHRISNRYLILGVPNEPLWRILNLCRFKYTGRFGNTPGHINHWSRKSIIKLVEQNYGRILAVESPIPWTIILAEKY
ncbi:Methyltransferase domain-containing protein [Salegentibacter echinorum]|uniref:Methyltransferase domain-containing protein n=1 Tax=Salegentibacter echinorum TaxID=1073325 RepID=A0A1M5JWH8_SALEC|nr:class I SAM-dependent methyltransferase [Salegentibacter echinorum]SHG44898.1 Methyltransferase domain-containing protein [Salegentibacter echinorum]